MSTSSRVAEVLAELKAWTKSSTADARIEAANRAEEMQKGIDATKAKLQDLGEAGEDAWKRLQDGVDSAWGTLGGSVRDPASKFK